MHIQPLNSTDNREYINRTEEKYPYDLGYGNIADAHIKITSDYAGEIRFGPPYYGVRIVSHDKKIWDSGTYGGELFNYNIISAPHNTVVLVRWYSFKSPSDEAVVTIDVQTCKETVVTKKGRYYFAGHFYSFNGIFYSKAGTEDVICMDLDSKKTFPLFETIGQKIQNAFSWSVSPVKNTIVVFTKALEQNVVLFDLVHQEILATATLPYTLSDNGSITSFLDKEAQKILVKLSDYDLSDTNYIINKRDEYYLIDFNI